ncbi:MAG: amino acid ABC transporter substrate-binding protein [Reyranella sp.]|nr:amino acid ABC transporter substrate-binding protein [Reyranella sp.]
MAGPVVEAAKARGSLNCGVGGDTAGFSRSTADGNWTGFAVDLCRAIAVAALDSPTKVKFVALPADRRFAALQAGEVDVLLSGTTLTMARDTQLGLDFPVVYLYDGQGFMVPRKLGKRSVKELAGASVCVTKGTTSERQLNDYSNLNKMAFKPVVFEKVEDLRAAFFGGRCDALTADATNLYATRAAYAANPGDYIILPQTISKEPLATVVRGNDPQFGKIVRWVIYGMLQAEEDGITSKNVDQALASDNPDARRLMGATSGLGKGMGIDDRWLYNIVKQVGNYGEVYDRNLGAGSQLKIPRGPNALWSQGGMQYSPPVR